MNKKQAILIDIVNYGPHPTEKTLFVLTFKGSNGEKRKQTTPVWLHAIHCIQTGSYIFSGVSIDVSGDSRSSVDRYVGDTRPLQFMVV